MTLPSEATASMSPNQRKTDFTNAIDATAHALFHISLDMKDPMIPVSISFSPGECVRDGNLSIDDRGLPFVTVNYFPEPFADGDDVAFVDDMIDPSHAIHFHTKLVTACKRLFTLYPFNDAKFSVGAALAIGYVRFTYLAPQIDPRILSSGYLWCKEIDMGNEKIVRFKLTVKSKTLLLSGKDTKMVLSEGGSTLIPVIVNKIAKEKNESSNIVE